MIRFPEHWEQIPFVDSSITKWRLINYPETQLYVWAALGSPQQGVRGDGVNTWCFSTERDGNYVKHQNQTIDQINQLIQKEMVYQLCKQLNPDYHGIPG